MAGGSGTRFWPISRKHKPKQFLDILGTGKTFLQMTYQRFETIVPKENFYIVTNDEYVSLVKDQLPFLSNEQILGEPIGRNTAPCIEYANQKIKAKNPQANIIVTPADHLIIETDRFLQDVATAIGHISNNEALVTLGITPTRPNTGYGYIQIDPSKPINNSLYKVKTFTEKPNTEMAEFFVKSGEFLWNSGMFFWNLQTIEKAFEKYLPETHNIFVKNFDKINSSKEKEIINEIYDQIKSISIDYAIMEKADNVNVIKSSFTWSDLGTWFSLYENKPKDANNNVINANQNIIYDLKDSLLYTTLNDKIYAIKGFSDIILVDTQDALLLINKNDDQSIKQIVNDMKINGKDKFL